MARAKKNTTVVLGDGRSFRTLNDVAHMRKRVGIMLGGTGVTDADWHTFRLDGDSASLALLTRPVVPAMLHAFREILDNCVDEYLKGGHCTEIEVTHTGPYSFSVRDNGRGIPPELFHVFMAARSGSNFDDAAISRGQNGVGAKAIRAVSSFFRVTSRYGGSTHTQTMTVGPAVRRLLGDLPGEAQNQFEEVFDAQALLGGWREAGKLGITEGKIKKALTSDGCVATKLPRSADPIPSKTGTIIEVTLNPYVFSESRKKEATGGGFLTGYSDISGGGGGGQAAEREAGGDEISTLAKDRPKDVPPLPPEIMDAICRETAVIFPKLKIRFNRASAGALSAASGEASSLYHFPRGMVGLAASLGFPRYRMLASGGAEGGKKFECEAIVMAGENGLNLSFVNGSSTRGGTHVDDLLTIVADEIRSSAREIKKLSKEIDVTRDDVRRATFLFVDVRMTAPSFSSQTKEILTDTWIRPFLKEMVQESVRKIIRSAPEIIDAIIAAARSRHDAKESKEVEKQLKKSTKTRPLKLVDANSRDRRNTMLFLAEGDSAAAGFRAVSDEQTMGILPLKGVVMNCANVQFTKAIKNDEILSIVQSLALPPPSEKRPVDAQLHFSRIVILTDADVDGAHIRSLLLTFFCTYWPWLPRGGHLYRATPPLFELLPARYAGADEDDIPAGCGWPKFALSEGERDAIIKKHPKERLVVSRNKGLGEMSSAAWRHTLHSSDCLVRLELDNMAMATIGKWSDKDAGSAAMRRDDLKSGMDQASMDQASKDT